MKYFYITAGLISLGFGFAGVVIPGLPATPFILLSAGLFVRSSESLYNRLLSNRIFGRYINDFRRKKGMSLKQKIYSITMMWSMIFLSAYSIDNSFFRISIFFAGIIGSIVMGFIVKTVCFKN